MQSLLAFLFLGVMQQAQPMPRHTSRGSSSASSYSQNQGEDHAGPSRNGAPLVESNVKSAPSKPYSGSEGGQNSDNGESKVRIVSVPPVSIVQDQKHWLDHAFDWGPWISNFLLVLVGAGQIVLLQRTWDEVHTQAGHMGSQTTILQDSLAAAKIAAEAAKKSADVAVNNARAWLSTDVRFAAELPDYAEQGLPNISAMVVTFENSGSSPAEVDRAEVLALFTEFQLPDEPVYIEEDVTGVGGEILPPGKTRTMVVPIKFWRQLNDLDREAIVKGEKFLYCYGYVEYTDNSGQTRRTQFGYHWRPRKGPADEHPEAMYRLQNRKYNFIT